MNRAQQDQKSSSRAYRIALVGQPNCGKSTFFNAVAGYRATASNFPGTTVSYTKSLVRIGEEVYELIDLPGTYSLEGSEPAEKLTREWLLNQNFELVVNILDASLLGRSLELTLELMELGIPLILCLNMMDEARRKGVEIDCTALSEILGIPVVPCIATKGEGIDRVFEQAKKLIENPLPPKELKLSQDVEEVYQQLKSFLGEVNKKLGYPERFFILKLLENDLEIIAQLEKVAPEKISLIYQKQKSLESRHGKSAGEVICSERHALALNIFEKVARVKPRQGRDLREQVDYWLMHKYLGYVFLGIILFLLFAFVFWMGKFLEEPLLGLFDRLQEIMEKELGTGLFSSLMVGLIQGIAGGVGIVLPYLVPFLFGLSFLEDIGYLPRAAYLMDIFMHRIGLHGKAVIPFVLGYGCSVPAVMSIRTLENPRDRFITGILVTMIPCSARTVIIFALVASLLGPGWAVFIYLLNIIVIAGVGRMLTLFQRSPIEGLVMEVPTYKVPSPVMLLRKTWFRLREFIVVAWPILILGSIFLSLLEFYHLDDLINRGLSPLVVYLLGLPEKVGMTLIFGILRKELSLIMLAQALGTTDFASVLSSLQILVFAVFVVFYVPCLATLAVLYRELGWRGVAGAFALTSGVALFISLACRLILGLVF